MTSDVKPPAATLLQRTIEAVTEATGGPVTEKRMFGGVSLMVAGAMVCAVRGAESLLVRVDPERSPHLQARPGAAMAQMGQERSMGPGWLTVRADVLVEDDPLREWIAEAARYHAVLVRGS